MQKFISTSLSDTNSIASQLAMQAKAGDVFLLKGNLGAGKTAFASGFINALLEKPQNITSPTFNIVQIYKSSQFPVVGSQQNTQNLELTTKNFPEIWHFDLYRLKSPDELYELGIEEALEKAICLIEWPEIAEDFFRNIKTTLIEIEKQGQGDDRVIRVGVLQ